MCDATMEVSSRHRRPHAHACRAAAATGPAGFTLVELLVVIGIIALLISILMPALAGARQQAQAVNCLSNLRQLTVAWVMYANDNKGRNVPTHTTQFNSTGTGDTWIAFLRPYYSQSAEIRNCPAAPEPLRQNINPFGIPQGTAKYAWGPGYDGAGTGYLNDRPDDFGGYGLNGWTEAPGPWVNGSGLPKDNFIRTQAAKVISSNVPVLGDCVWCECGWPFEGMMPPTNYERPLVGVDSQLARYAMYRHKKSVNISFMDGSARVVQVPKELWQLQWHRNWDLSRIPSSMR